MAEAGTGRNRTVNPTRASGHARPGAASGTSVGAPTPSFLHRYFFRCMTVALLDVLMNGLSRPKGPRPGIARAVGPSEHAARAREAGGRSAGVLRRPDELRSSARPITSRPLCACCTLHVSVTWTRGPALPAPEGASYLAVSTGSRKNEIW